MTLYAHLATLYRLLACQVFEDLSAICGPIGWPVPW